MSDSPNPRRGWIETCLVFCLWGTDGLERGKSLSRSSLFNGIGLTVTWIFVCAVQENIWQAGRFTGFPIDPHQDRVSNLTSAFNLAIFVVALYFYKRNPRRALWFGALATLLGTIVAILIDQLFREFLD